MVCLFSTRRLSASRILTAAVLLGVAACIPLQAFAVHHERPKRATKETVEALEKQWRQAQLSGDVVAMDRLLSDDFVGITASGQVTTKMQQLARIRDRDIVLTQLDFSDVKVKLIGLIVAVVTSRAEIKGTSDGVPISGTFRYTRVYQRVASGVWKITSFESTRVPEGGSKGHAEAAASQVPNP
jgi:ketosteroid isomerase-like protein